MAQLKSLIVGPSVDRSVAVMEIESDEGQLTVTLSQPTLAKVIEQLQKIAEELRARTQ